MQSSLSQGRVPEVWTGLVSGDQPSTAWHLENEGLGAQIPALSPGSPTL